MIVGRNNSGKTSLTDVFDRFGPNGPSFRLQDFSATNRRGFVDAKAARDAGASPMNVLALLPRIAVTLTFSYDKAAADVGPLSPFIIDLDANSNTVIARLEYSHGLPRAFKSRLVYDQLSGVARRRGILSPSLRWVGFQPLAPSRRLSS